MGEKIDNFDMFDNEDEYDKKELEDAFKETKKIEDISDEELEKELSDIDDYFDFDDQIDMAQVGIQSRTAKKYKIITKKHPLDKNSNPTKKFLSWVKKNDKEAFKLIKTEEKDKHELTPYKKIIEKEKKNSKKENDNLFESIMDDVKPEKKQLIKQKTIEIKLEDDSFDDILDKEEAKEEKIIEKSDDLFDDDIPVKTEEEIAESDDLFDDDIPVKTEEEIAESDDLFDNDIPVKTKKRKTTIQIEPILFDMKTYPIIILLWGYDGTSKSEQIMKFVDSKGRYALIFDFENKLRPLAFKLGFPQENIITSGKYNETYGIDGPTTLREFRNVLKIIRKKVQNDHENIKFSALALDGISDIRPFAKDEWILEKKRQKPVTAGDWSEINDKVREIVFTMINLGRAEEINIFLTAQVGGEYKKNVRIRDVPDCKNWIWHNVDHKFLLFKDEEQKRFYAFCEKSFYNPFWTLDLTDFNHSKKPSMLNILQDINLIKKHVEEHEKIQEEIEYEVSKSSDLF